MKPIRVALFLCLGGSLLAQNSPENFRANEKYYSDSMGSRLVVRPENREGSYASQLELRIEDETFFDNETSEFREREIATIRGGGLGNLGLRFYTERLRSQEEFLQILENFQDKISAFRRHRSEIEKLDESWMGSGDSAISQSRVITQFQTDFISRPSVVSMNWDLGTSRLWLSLDDFINIDSTIAEPLSRLIERIPVYSRQRQEYEEAIKEKNSWIDQTLSLPEDSEDMPTADRVDTPTVISDEIEEAESREKGKEAPSDGDSETIESDDATPATK